MRSAWKTLGRLREGGAPEADASVYGRDEIQIALEAVQAIIAEPEASPTQAVEFARALMGQYRARDFVDVETFASSLSSVFQHYRRSLCRLAVDPMVGLPSEAKFPPSVQEVKEWLDRETGRLEYYRWRTAQVQQTQLAGPKPVPQIEPRVDPKRAAEILAAVVDSLPPSRPRKPNPTGVDHSIPYPIMKGE